MSRKNKRKKQKQNNPPRQRQNKVKQLFTSTRVDPLEIAREIFGGTYYCIAEEFRREEINDTVNS